MDNIFSKNLRGFEIKFKTRPGVFSPGGLDSGTGLLIENMEVLDGTQVCDLGAGNGILGFVAANLNPRGHVHLLDDHLRSVESAKENVELNGLRNMEVYLSDLFSAVSDRSYHQILSNPPQQLGNEFLEEMIEQSFKHLKPGGSLWLVVKSNLKPVIERMMGKYFKNVKIISHSKKHVVFKGLKNG